MLARWASERAREFRKLFAPSVDAFLETLRSRFASHILRIVSDAFTEPVINRNKPGSVLCALRLHAGF